MELDSAQYKCPLQYCNIFESSRDKLKIHIQSHANPDKIYCEICCRWIKDLQKHINCDVHVINLEQSRNSIIFSDIQ